MIKINKFFDVEQILLELESLNNKSKQISLQSPDGDYNNGIGKIEWNPGYTEKDYCSDNLPHHWELNRAIKELKLYRTRIMTLSPKECYSWHFDRSPRIHLALETNENCFFVEDKELVHIPSDGYPYWVDTTKYHTAMNCDLNINRIHLVGCTDMVVNHHD